MCRKIKDIIKIFLPKSALEKYLKYKHQEKTGSFGAICKDFNALKFDIKSTIRHLIDNQKIAKENNLSKIHFGCGNDYREGWLNIDISSKADYWIDLRNKINIKDESSDFIFSSHMVEHFRHVELIHHLRECHRILKTGGRIRIGIPDFPSIVKNYGNKQFLKENMNVLTGKFDGIPDDLICYMDFVNRAFHFSGHKIGLDVEKMTNLLIFVGFNKNKIVEKEYEEGLDKEARKGATFYIEAEK